MTALVLLLLATHGICLFCGIWIGAHHPAPVHADPRRPHPETVAARPPPVPKRTAKCKCGLSFLMPDSLPAIHFCAGCGRRSSIQKPIVMPLPPPPNEAA